MQIFILENMIMKSIVSDKNSFMRQMLQKALHFVLLYS